MGHLLLLSLLGCLAGSYYPDPATRASPPVWDTAVPTQPPTTPPLPCNRPDEGTVARLTVNNPTADIYQLSTMNETCAEVSVVTLFAQQSYTTNIGNHVVWVVRDIDGYYVRTFSLPSGANVQWVETVP